MAKIATLTLLEDIQNIKYKRRNIYLTILFLISSAMCVPI